MDKTGMLKNTALFSGFGDKELSRLLDTAKERSFATGDVIIKEDHPGGRGFYVLLEGAAEVRKGQPPAGDVCPRRLLRRDGLVARRHAP